MRRRDCKPCGYNGIFLENFIPFMPLFCCEDSGVKKVSHNRRRAKK